MTPTVVNKYKEEYDVYIGRGSKWGNPFVISPQFDRATVIELYRKHLFREIKQGNITRTDFEQLSGKRLGCFCKPKACHGDVIINAYNWIMKDDD